jgi:hypothetical protein
MEGTTDHTEFVGWSAISVSSVGFLVDADETHPAAVSGSGVTEQLGDETQLF